MNYEAIYNSLIQKRLQNKLDRSICYCEYHHIKPRSIYPELVDDQTNIVALTAKEHYIAHHLLMHWYKLLYGEYHINYYKMLMAFQYTANIQTDNNNFITARQYDYIRKERAKIGVPDYVKQLMKDNHYDVNGKNNPAFGRRMLFNIKTQQKYFCKQFEVQKYLDDGWVSIYDISLYNNGKIEVYDISCPKGFKPGHLKIQTDIEKQKEHENRSNSQKGKRFLYDPITLRTVTAKPDEIQSYLDKGYKFGRKLNRKSTNGYIWIYNEKLDIILRIDPKQFQEYQKNGYIKCPKQTIWNNGKIEIKSVKQPAGFIKGCLHIRNVDRHVKNKNIIIVGNSKKRIWIINNKTGDKKYIQERFLETYIQNGYIKMIKRHYNK